MTVACAGALYALVTVALCCAESSDNLHVVDL